MNTYIVVATHKKFKELQLPDCYHIIKNGSVYNSIPEYISDSIGENLSEYQPLLCELTSLYYAWKNEKYDILGICHYRRYFSWSTRNESKILTSKDYEKILKKYDVILPKKSKYYFCSPIEYYMKYHNKKTVDLRIHYIQLLKKSIVECYPKYEASMNNVFNRKSAHLKNMFVMRSELIDSFCEFMFTILLNIDKQEKFRDRALGTVGEFLIDVWIEYNKLTYKELSIYSQEREKFAILKGMKKICKKK